VALAAQNILGDLFASLSIVLDKPFVMGDFIIVGSQMGTVEKVGLKTTRVRALSGEQLIFANTDLLQSRIQNFKRMQERRVVFTIGVLYETPREKLAEIPRIIREIVESQDGTRFDRSHFKEFGDFSLNFETVYYVQVPDYNVYMDVQQAINLAMFERLAAEGIEFAYPTQKLYVRTSAALDQDDG
jgi:small-conductance mechanosensitive channel